jgi:hypothetical protein
MTATWTDISANKADGAQLDSDLLNAMLDNINFLRDPAAGLYALSVAGANITTTSTSFVDLTGFTKTITTQGRPVEICFDARVASTNARFDFQVDGATITGDVDGLGAVTPASTFGNNSFRRVVALAAGSHTFKVQWRVTTGTGTVYAAGLAQFYVAERVSNDL